MSSGYAIVVTRAAQKELDSLDIPVLRRVAPKIDELAANPRPPGCRKLSGVENRWRIRVGDYRVIYAVDDAGRVVEVIAFRHRSNAYDRG